MEGQRAANANAAAESAVYDRVNDFSAVNIKLASPHDIGKLLDLNSFVLAGGVDRSIERFEQLFRATGFRLRRTLRTTNALALLEVFPDTA